MAVKSAGKQSAAQTPNKPFESYSIVGPPNQFRVHIWRMLVVGTLVIAAHSNSFEASLIFDNAAIVGRYKRIRAAWRTTISAMLSRTPGRFEDGIAEFRAALRFSPDFGKVQHGAALSVASLISGCRRTHTISTSYVSGA